MSGPIGWGCRIHQLHLYRGVRLPATSVLDMILNNIAGALENIEYLFIAIAPKSTLTRSGST